MGTSSRIGHLDTCGLGWGHVCLVLIGAFAGMFALLRSSVKNSAGITCGALSFEFRRAFWQVALGR